MKRALVVFLVILSATLQSFSQSNQIPYYSRYDFQSAAPGAIKFGLYGYDNPAALSYATGTDLQINWSDKSSKGFQDHWGLFLASPNAGFGMIQERFAAGISTRYNTAFAFGDRNLSGGISYNWTYAKNPLLDQSDYVTLGALSRLTPMFSVGGTYASVTKGNGWNGAVEVGVRPFSNEMLTLFGEYVFQRMPLVKNEVWSAGAVVEPVSGIRLTGRYFENKSVNLGIQLNFGNAGIETQSHFNGNQKYEYNTYGVRAGMYDGNAIDLFTAKKSKYISVDFGGRINYQRFEFFDKSKTLSSILSSLDAIKNDPSVAGIAINTSAMMANRELLWEVREKLKECKTAGKKIIVFIDRGNIDTYHFASVADKIVMDPLGIISIEGFMMGRTFLKGTLEKIGIGFDEWRFFKYKSASESMSLDKMSDADREQRQAIVNAWYEIAKKDICESRSLTPAKFDELVNSYVVIAADQARSLGLADTLGRWETVKDIVKNETGSDKNWKSASSSVQIQTKKENDRWGERPKIAVIYALGACAMDDGINARSLVKDVEKAVDDNSVKAIVLRVDSPGGDAMASDYIAEALKKAKGKKPVIVSQGFVAASGGYWLSMYADTIVAAPGTITGSIGVIGGWLYNKGLKETLGMSTDLVKVGAHADIGFGFQMPLIGLGVPDRNMTTEERARVEELLRAMYKEFIAKVASGREMKEDSIGVIAQGRVWSGIDGKAIGLVDILGGLETAIDVAKERAGLKNETVKIIEIPKKGFFDFSAFVPKLIGVETPMTKDQLLEQLKFRLQYNGKPLPMIPMEETDMLIHSAY